jgi:hypothetical protein
MIRDARHKRRKCKYRPKQWAIFTSQLASERRQRTAIAGKGLPFMKFISPLNGHCGSGTLLRQVLVADECSRIGRTTLKMLPWPIPRLYAATVPP